MRVILLCLMLVLIGCEGEEKSYPRAQVDGRVLSNSYSCHGGVLYYVPYSGTTLMRGAQNNPITCSNKRLTASQYKAIGYGGRL